MSDVPGGFLAACDRFVHAAAGNPVERARQARLISVLLAAPFALGVALGLGLAPILGPAAILIVPMSAAALAWALVLVTTLSGRRVIAERAALAMAFVAVAVLSYTFGAASPALLLAGAVVIEAYWVGNDRRSARTGAIVAAAGLLGGLAAADISGQAQTASGVWQWLLPAFYVAASWNRVRALFSPSAPAPGAVQEDAALADRFALATLELGAGTEIVSASHAAAERFGVSLDLLVGESLLDRVHVADRVVFLSALANAGEKAMQPVEMRLRVARIDQPGSAYRPFAADFAPGSLPGSTALLLREAGEIVDLRTELKDAREAAESMELAKSHFLAAVSHELRTPLNSIIGFSDMLMHGLAGDFADVRQRDYVELIRQSGTHLLSVVNAILDVSKIESEAYGIHPEPFVFAEAAELCRSMMAQQAGQKRVVLKTHVEAGTGEICADRRAVQQIMLNLLGNAIKFTPAEGEVAMDARRQGEWLSIRVTDTGIGIAKEDLRRIGRPFTQVQNDLTRHFDGAGLGLSLVKGLVRLHEGEMTIESAPGEGTVVNVRLPVAGPRVSRAGAEPLAGPKGRGGDIGGLNGQEFRKTA